MRARSWRRRSDFFRVLLAPSGISSLRAAAADSSVMPQMLSAYHGHLEATDPLSDGATARWLRTAIGDLTIDAAEGEALLTLR